MFATFVFFSPVVLFYRTSFFFLIYTANMLFNNTKLITNQCKIFSFVVVNFAFLFQVGYNRELAANTEGGIFTTILNIY